MERQELELTISELNKKIQCELTYIECNETHDIDRLLVIATLVQSLTNLIDSVAQLPENYDVYENN